MRPRHAKTGGDIIASPAAQGMNDQNDAAYSPDEESASHKRQYPGGDRDAHTDLRFRGDR